MKVEIKRLNSGSYYLVQDKLSFECDSIEIAHSHPYDRDITIEIDKESALEIMHTLLDSVYMLDNHTEKLLEQIEERINSNER